MSDVSNLRDTIIPKSNQLNADELLAGPITIKISNVRRDNSDQPIIINYDGDGGRPYKPCKSMRKVLVFAWGENGLNWIGRSMTLFCDPDVVFGGEVVGGTRISHMSDIDGDLKVTITVKRGKKAQYIVKKLELQKTPPKQPETPEVRTPKMIAAFGKLSVTESQLATHLMRESAHVGVLTEQELAVLTKIYKAITTGGEYKTVYFPDVVDTDTKNGEYF